MASMTEGRGDPTDTTQRTAQGYEIKPLAYLWEADLSGEDLSNADLRGAALNEADLRGANLCNATLTGASMEYASLCDADLTGAYLLRAALRCADLRGATLTAVSFEGAELEDADFTGCSGMPETSHDLIAEILRHAARGNERYRAIAGLLLVSRDWCWATFRALANEWDTDVLRWVIDSLSPWREYAVRLRAEGFISLLRRREEAEKEAAYRETGERDRRDGEGEEGPETEDISAARGDEDEEERVQARYDASDAQALRDAEEHLTIEATAQCEDGYHEECSGYVDDETGKRCDCSCHF